LKFDIQTLSVLVAVSSLVFAFASFTVARMIPAEKHLKDWSLGAGLAAISTLLVGLRGNIPEVISAAVANSLLTFGFCFLYTGTRGLLQRPKPGPWLWLMGVLGLVTLGWYTLVDTNVTARVVIVSLLAAPILGLMAWEFWRYDRKLGKTPLRAFHLITTLICSVGAMLFVFRVAIIANGATIQNYASSGSVLFVAPYMWAILFNGWFAIAVTLTVGSHLLADLTVARDAAQATNVAKGRFLANMSHEIRTPMNAILGLLSLMQATALDERQRDYTTKTERAAKSLLNLLNDILDFSKVDAGKMVLEAVPFSLPQLMQDLTVLLRPLAATSTLEVQFELDPALPACVQGDPMRLQQVLLNLGANAIKFTPEGRVRITVESVGAPQGEWATLRFSVQDTGIGIAPEHQAQIFEGFAQAEASTTRRFGGTGLGLAISKRLVALMGGEVRLQSALGAGSTFSFELTFPVVHSLPQDDPGSVPVANPGSGTLEGAVPVSLDVGAPLPGAPLAGMRILLVEDNPINQQVAFELLSAQGALVSVADDGQQGVEAVRNAPTSFDVVLMDVQMPVLDGYGATHAIRHDLQLPDLPIIAMTANAMRVDRDACFAAGMNEHVSKPFDIQALVKLLLRMRRPPSA